jgi:hypothetical protein
MSPDSGNVVVDSLPPLSGDDLRLINKSFNALNYYFEAYKIHNEKIQTLERQVEFYKQAVLLKDEQSELREAECKQCDMNLSTCTDDLAKANRKIKRKSFFGNTKFVVGIGIGVVGTMLIMK